MKILLAIEEAAGIQTLKAVHQSEHTIVAVLTASAAHKDNQRGATVAGVAQHLGYPLWPAKLVKQADFAEQIKSYKVDVLLNVHSLYIIHADVVAAPSVGAFNLHPGLLPSYAGMNAPSWALYNGETQHGVSLHWMEAGIDTGKIAYQASFALKPSDTGLSVSTQCVRLGLELIKDLLATPSRDIPKLEQSSSERKYYGFEKPHNGTINWNMPAAQLERWVRASDFYPLPSPWGSPRASFAGHDLGLLKVALSYEACHAKPGNLKRQNDQIFVATQDEWLELKRLFVDQKLVNASDFFQGNETLENG